MRSSKKILVSLELPIQYRNFVGSGLIDYLAIHFYSITIICNPDIHQQKFILPENVNIIPLKNFRFRKLRIALYKAAQYNQIIESDTNYIHKAKWVRGYKNKWLIKLLQKLLSRNLKRVIIFLSNIDFLINYQRWNKIRNYDIYISSTYIWQYYDILVGLYCKKRKIPWVGQITSWDNPTSKGKFIFQPDKIIVWGNQNRNEASKYLEFNTDNIIEIPPPQFELLKRVKRMPLFECKMYLYFLGTSKDNYYWEKELIELILSYTEKYEDLKDLIILLRPHPNDKDNWWKRFLNHPNLELDNEVQSRNIETGVFTTDYQHQVEFYKKIKQSIGIITYFSTTVIEAGLLEIPALIPYFVPFQKRPQKMFGDEYPHLSFLKEHIPNDFILYSDEQLVSSLIKLANGKITKSQSKEMYEVCCYTANIKKPIFQSYHNEFINITQEVEKKR
jgi:hypothetical protein